jgi:hypothetical protein
MSSFLNSPSITAKETERLKRNDERAKLQAQYDAVEDEVEQELKGT